MLLLKARMVHAYSTEAAGDVQCIEHPYWLETYGFAPGQ